ncbi:MAG TPA: sigma-70 family RNA polymerase sigma factor [Tepidisphaeraceae bacterium]|nr:sigma-70 family RNA polymerase sigma factor [Tepidisphaeraceae bacterium]
MTATPIRAEFDGPVTAAPAAGASDESLAVRLREGDQTAGEELVRRHAPALLRYLQRLTGNDHAAEELHQQAWCSVLEHLDKFRPAVPSPGSTATTAAAPVLGPVQPASGGFRAWLYRIATNKANDQWRSRGRERSAKQGLRLVTDDVLPDASVRLDATEQEVKLKRAIAQLPDNQRQVLLLRYYSGLKFVEIADMLGCPLNTALGRMHKATVKLRQLMDG